MARIHILLLAVFMVATGCTNSMLEETFTEGSEISLTWKGTVQVKYNQAEGQLGYNSKKNEYRVYDDKLSSWFTIKCSEKPVTESQIIEASVSWTGTDNTKSFTEMEFKVTKTDDTGLVWLWNSSNKIGIIVKNL